jgi:leader peptidase (prepilin peptidase)/N-methyltransferase
VVFPFDGPIAWLTLTLWLWFAAWATALTIVDVREHRLPNRMVAMAFAGCVMITGAQALLAGDPTVVVGALGGAGVAVSVFLVGHVVGGIGMGDVKYAAVTGWVLGTIGWSAVWWGHVVGFVLAGAVVIAGMLLKRLHRRSAVPFGPFMGGGSLVVGLGAIAGLIG